MKFSSFGKMAALAASGLAMAATLGMGQGDWSAQRIDEMNGWQARGIAEGVFTGTVKNDTSFAGIQGTYAQINPLLHAKPAIIQERVLSTVGNSLDFQKDPDLYAKMTYDHERSHVEYQTGMPSRFDAPGISPKDRVAVERGLEFNDGGSYASLRTRLHGAMHERFAEIYSGMVMIKEAEAGDDARVHDFLVRRAGARADVGFIEKHVHREFAHELGCSMDAVVAMDPQAIKAMAPNQLKAAALRAASLAYLADAKDDPTLSAMLDHSLAGPSSKALWSKAGSLTGSEIAKRAMSGLPAPAHVESVSLEVPSLKFGSNSRVSREVVAPDESMSAARTTAKPRL